MPTFPTKTIEVEEGATDVSLYLNVYTSGGVASTGLVSVDVSTARFVRDRQATVSVSTSDLAAITSAHADGGLKEISSAQFPGLYRFDLPDAAFAALNRQNNKVRIKLTFSDGSSSESELLEIVLIKPENDIWDALGASHLVADSMGEKMKGLAPDAGVVSGTPSASQFETDLVGPNLDDNLKDQVVIFIDGNLEGSARRITNNVINGTNEINVEPAFEEAPAVSDRCVVISAAQARGIADAVWDEKIATRLQGSPGTAAGALVGLAPKQGMTPAVGGTPTATAFDSDQTDADDFWNGQFLTFIEGNLAGQSRRITDFVNTNGRFTVSPAFAAAPAVDSEFTIVASEDILGFPMAELAAVPGATPAFIDGVMWLYMKTRNLSITDDTGSPTKHQVHKDDGTKIADADVSDTGASGKATRAKYV